MTRKELVVSALENGTVLDHIPAKNIYKALDILNLKGVENQITIGINLASKQFGQKGIIKVADKFFEDEELNKLALIAPKATVNVIRDFKVVEKKVLKMPKEYKAFLDSKGIEYIETTSLDEHLNDCDILYMTRVQQERFTDPVEYERVKDVYTLTASMLGQVKQNMKILHPLPRVTEITQDVDETPYAYYFKQAENGLYVRMAIISYLLGYR